MSTSTYMMRLIMTLRCSNQTKSKQSVDSGDLLCRIGLYVNVITASNPTKRERETAHIFVE